jgi:ARG and Rhodanese-Phosphatase-superfamily-associated Protein domain
MKLVTIGTYTALAMALTAGNARAAVGSISDSATYRNLQIFLVHGDAQLEDRHYVTLSEAMARRMVVVKETGNVNELSIENRSRKEIVFLNAGDIVKGGRQDRTVRDDLVLPPDSGQVALASFCVEHGRWTQRGSEDAAAFGLNSKVLSSRQLKMASRYENNQSYVWSGVAEQQEKLTSNVSKLSGKQVQMRSPLSSSSLQLTLENKDLEDVKQQLLDRLCALPDGQTDLIGFVSIINGEINSAEVYNNKALFRALWPKLLDAAVTEAITDYCADRNFQPLQATDLRAFFETSVSGTPKERTVSKTTCVKTYTTPTTLLFETLDMDAGGAWIHKSFLNKGTEKVVVPLDSGARGSRQ